MCLINELARYNKLSHQYRLTDESGPAHKKTFTVCLKLGTDFASEDPTEEEADETEDGSKEKTHKAKAAAQPVVAEEYVAAGPSIKKAQHAAAAIALERTKLRHPTAKPKQVKNSKWIPFLTCESDVLYNFFSRLESN